METAAETATTRPRFCVAEETPEVAAMLRAYMPAGVAALLEKMMLAVLPAGCIICAVVPFGRPFTATVAGFEAPVMFTPTMAGVPFCWATMVLLVREMFKLCGWPPEVPEPLLQAAARRQIAARQGNVPAGRWARWRIMGVCAAFGIAT